ncbi:uncharacterized protein LOC123498111 isoform X1 [Portunus trituberculatus]|uniref:uncharacterized protein LOC123498111 isoform X1 n=1 Tax=Portunus trituberculatus TaxID=210409 RepID=UPI001E1CCCE4|nr:uncharacterized protein LOC123498111 isoform X1 [Portunus trituberculatus]
MSMKWVARDLLCVMTLVYKFGIGVKNEAWITCSHVPGAVNLLADAASRKFNDRHEWKLNEDIFQELCKRFGVPSIDLFASRLNKQVPRFCSWLPDPEAEFFYAFSISWSQFELIYAFPPFALITRCLQKIRAEMARGWMIVPLWPSQPWMGVLIKMLIREPLLIPRRRNVLRQPSTLEEHPIMTHTRLLACLLSRNTCENVEYLRQAQTSSWPHGDPQPQSSIGHTLLGGYNFVICRDLGCPANAPAPENHGSIIFSFTKGLNV